jgi:hypothetical protein
MPSMARANGRLRGSRIVKSLVTVISVIGASMIFAAGTADATNFSPVIPWPRTTTPHAMFSGDHLSYGSWRLNMQNDGNLVLRDSSNRACWASGTQNHKGAYASYQHDGNFVVYAYVHGPALWASDTVGRTGTQYNVSIYGGQFYVGKVLKGRC